MKDDDSPKKKRGWVWARDIALFAAIILGVMAYQTWDHLDRGSPAPAFDLAMLDSDTRVSTASFAGKPSVIYFWAPWCGVCEANSHNLAAVREAVGDDANVVSVALAFRGVEEVREFADRNNSRPVLLGTNAVHEAYAISAFPTLYVLDRDGRITSSVVGYTTELGIRARLWWAGI